MLYDENGVMVASRPGEGRDLANAHDSGGDTKSYLCVSFSVVFVMILSLSYVGVHKIDHDNGWPCARTTAFSTELVAGLVGFPSEMHAARASTPWPLSKAVHGSLCFPL